MIRFALDFDVVDVLRARARLRPHLAPTPLRSSRAAGGADVLLKLECWQPTGSFKVRGALNLIGSLTDEELSRGLVAASAGNHALGVANAVAALGVSAPTTLFVPDGAPRAKVERLRQYPVTVELVNGTYEEAQVRAFDHAASARATFVHAYDDARTAAGQGTVALEILEASPDVTTIVVPVGGGGLISGVAIAAKALSPAVRIVAVQPEASPALRESVKAGHALLDYPAERTIADGLAGGIGEMVFENRRLIDDMVVVTEDDLEAAVVALVREDHVVAEGSGAVGLAAVRSGRLAVDGPTAVVITGGNIDGEVLADLMARHR